MIRFSGTDGQMVSFGASDTFAPSTLSISTFITLNDVTTLGSILQNFYTASIPPAPSGLGWGLFVQSGVLIFQALCTSSPFAGSWTTPITTGMKHIALTMNFSSVANNPIIYIDGVSATVTETSTPAGNFPSGSTNTSFYFGDVVAGGYSAFNGDIHNFNLYNVILSQAEVTLSESSRKSTAVYRGLVFSPNLNGAAGSIADGDNMSSSNTIRCNTSGLIGTPNTNPVFKNNNVLHLGGE